ncbi:MAG: ABC transporter substrate-binding protein, partial [Clostridia bacterium]|nr:ABC transporter substrate-binding protein [Clostridia bacterium]
MKKLISLALCMIMALSCFAGCQGGSGNEFILGAIGPLTGTASTYGQSVRNGMQIAVDEINAAGGINGVQVKMLFEDDEADGAKAKSAYEKLMDDGM